MGGAHEECIEVNGSWYLESSIIALDFTMYDGLAFAAQVQCMISLKYYFKKIFVAGSLHKLSAVILIIFCFCISSTS